ncbi:flavin reductase (DIM6/NTAB) family NADH-FMN oxidoreductase RutF [Lacibacter cauensis]|uniref:Flavin reductase (DIM6/NTAB) family NADH-FMN oxidoreductase RutF n=2 Tax=Lacibacter cauensis TaxID=510947 RepID=A0A562SM84_9BACT|nr:flavin reductase (DIM6/NTAB) family NADH-FMN oxidoreductase RutF [Lacibacter cauensis]
MIIDLQQLNPMQKQQWLQHAVAPRPVCFASTIDKEGNVNLSPFSFFNLFSSNPPIVVFSPARRVRDNSTKHTLENVLEVPEVVINIVDYDMVQQVSLSSCEFPKGTNEFIKAGFTQEAATLVQPPMVKESKVKMECKVVEVKPLGSEGGAGNLVICEVLRMHVDDSILNAEGTMIDQRKLQLIARLGGDWYCKVDEQSLFHVAKPNTQLGIGIDALPETIRNSSVLTGNNLGQLANVHEYPTVDATFEDERLKNIIQYFSINPDEMDKELHKYAKELLDAGNVTEAWQVLLADS